MTTDASQQPQLLSASRPRGANRFPPLLLACALGAASFGASAQSAPQAAIAPTENTAAATVTAPTLDAATTDANDGDNTAPATGLRAKAAQAATATLTALLPQLTAGNTLPLLDRSADLASDLSHLLPSYHLAQNADLDAGAVQRILKSAVALLGTPYRWGGNSPNNGLDCSGLVKYVFQSVGVQLPRVSRDQAKLDDAELIKDPNELKQGDLVFFGDRGRIHHVGIYVGEGRFLHAPRTGKDVRVDSLDGYWATKFIQARRVPL